jgi:endonuclease-8
MPEGHVIHRLAAEIDEAFAGRPVSASSPQGRFAAELIDGSRLLDAEAFGKHLFLDFEGGHVVHIHLGLIGKLRWTQPGPPSAPGTLRLRLERGGASLELRGPQTCEVVTPDERAAIVAELGPDPLRPDADPERGWTRLRRSSRPVAALLMDQRIAAGVGNIYRCEVLFRARLSPFRPGVAVSRAEWDALWTDLVELMPFGVSDGRIDTVLAEHTPEAMGRPPRVDRHGGEVYVYRRAGDPCFVCGRGISQQELAGRKLYWCETCQAGR